MQYQQRGKPQAHNILTLPLVAALVGAFVLLPGRPARAETPGDSATGVVGASHSEFSLLGEPFLLEQPMTTPILGQATGRSVAEMLGLEGPKGLHISGFLQENFGLWQNADNLRGLTNSRNAIAFARTLLQLDVNYQLNENNSFFLRSWFVYEPPYSFDANVPPNGGSPAGPNKGNPGNLSPWGNEFYNQYSVRDAWWKTTLGPLTLYTGNQIVVWGQSLAFRVGDVINPQDFTWGFGFANLEQSRQPQWMLHPILNLPDWGPFTSNFLEAVWLPGFQPMWNNINYADGRFNDKGLIAGRVNNGFTGGINTTGARFMVRVDGTSGPRYPGRDAPLVIPGAPNVPPPISREFYDCGPQVGGGGFLGLVNPAYMPAQHPVIGCGAVLANLGAGGSGVVVPSWHVPPVTWGNMEWGLRAHTITPDGTELTGFYFHTNTYFPNVEWIPGTPIWELIYHPIDYVGLTADRPVPVPESLGEYLPMVARVESVYTNHAPYGSFDPYNLRGVQFSDVLNNMVAFDIDQAYAPWLTTTGNLTANFEFVDQITLDASQNMLAGSAFGPAWGAPGGQISESVNKHDVAFLFNAMTSYWWEAIKPQFIAIYAPKGTTFLLLPSVEFDPPWSKDYFLKLQAVELLSSDQRSADGGAFKGYSYLSLLFQYNFNLL